MDKTKDKICCGCLSSDRQMLLIEDRSSKQCFFQIISEISMLYLSDEQLKLCWECERYIRKWSKFKEQVKHAYRTMHDFIGETFPKNMNSSLITRKLYDFTITPPQEDIDALQIVKKEDNYNYTDLSGDRFQIILPNDCHSESQNDTFLTRNGTILSDKDSYQSMNDTLQPKVNCAVRNNDNISLNGKEVSVNNNSDVSENGIFLPSYDVNMSNVDNNLSNDDTNLTAVKDDSDDELLVTYSKDFNKKKRKEKKKGEKKKDYFNGRVSQRKIKTRKKSKFYKEVKLSKEELMKERKVAELMEEYVNAMFRCEKCITSFPNADDLTDHIRLKHELPESKHKCPICECLFNSIVSYNYHKKKHKIRFECIICKERFVTTRSVTKHHQLMHTWHKNDSSERFPCELCNKTFKWKTSLRKHVETHSIETGQKRKPYCEPCRLSFSTTSNLRKHVKSSSNHQIQLKLIKLKEIHSDDPPNSEKQVARIQQIKSSVLKSTQQYRCPHCDRMFQWRGNLHRHIANHAARASGELVCKPCDRTFSSIETYNQHMNISKKHVTENNFKYVCSDCGRRFSNKTKLRDHIDWEHLKNYVHTCTHCEKVFKSRTSLFLHHRAVHKKDRLEHLCDHCGKAFPNHVRLRAHIEGLHTNETPYKCGICPAKFNWQACLSRHVKKVHGSQKRHKQDDGA